MENVLEKILICFWHWMADGNEISTEVMRKDKICLMKKHNKNLYI